MLPFQPHHYHAYFNLFQPLRHNFFLLRFDSQFHQPANHSQIYVSWARFGGAFWNILTSWVIIWIYSPPNNSGKGFKHVLLLVVTSILVGGRNQALIGYFKVKNLGGVFKHFSFSPLPGEMIHFWRASISDGLLQNHQLENQSSFPQMLSKSIIFITHNGGFPFLPGAGSRSRQ